MPSTNERAAGPTTPTMGASRDEQPVARSIPLYFRLVPKDIWTRMHVDTRATIGSVKDALLDKIQMPPSDPSLSPLFYEEAKAAMSRQSATLADVRAFPKAFVARAPKRTIKEVIKAEQEADTESIASSRMAMSSIGRRLPNARSLPAAVQARAILGGDAGLGGRGSLGFVLVDGRQNLVDVSGPHDHNSPFGSNVRHASLTTVTTIPDQRTSSRPNATSSPTPQRRLSAGAQGRAAAERPVMSALSEAGAGPPNSSQDGQIEARKPSFDPTLAAGLDAYYDFFEGGLPGNEDAKRSEEAAMASIRALNPGGTPTKLSSSAYPDRTTTSSSAAFQSPAMSSPKASSTRHEDDDEMDDDVEDGDLAYKELVAHSRSLSLHSMSSVDSLASKGESHVEGSSSMDHAKRSLRLSNLRSSSPTSSKGERARSGTIMPGDVQRGKAAVGAVIEATAQGSSTPSTISTSSSSDMQVPDVEASELPKPRLTEMQIHLQPSFGTALDHDAARSKGTSSRIGTISSNRRLAGIYTDEISSWKEAQHGQARYFSIHSFANGHMLEDWRTVAAFRIRPYELLEVQYADPHEKVHLPRVGDTADPTTRTGSLRSKEETSAAISSASSRTLNPAFDQSYMEPICEAWCYIFRPGAATHKAQRAGLGLWKLRYVSLRSNKLSVFRRKQARSGIEQMSNVWNLETVESVISERADGATRPVLMPITGLCQDTLTLAFASAFVPPNSIHDEGPQFKQPCLSMRFITQVDHCAFFKACARAHYRSSFRHTDPRQAALAFEWRRKALARATIAGMGGTVIPGKAARRGGRNALARTRLRPSGVSRDFDDADRWSSESEDEDTLPSETESTFKYTDAAMARDDADMPDIASTPSAPSMTFFNPGSEQETQAEGGTPRSAVSWNATGASPLSATKSATAATSRQTDPAGRRRGFTLGASHSPSGNEQNLRASPFGRDAGVRSSDRTATRLQTPERVGLGVTSDPSPSPSPAPSPSTRHVVGSSEQSSPTRRHVRQNSRTIGSAEGQFVLTPPSPSVGRATRQTGEMRTIPQSQPLSDRSERESTLQTPPLGHAASLEDQRPIVSSFAEEEQSPAAQAIRSFLAQRSASSATSPARPRSSTIVAPPSPEAPGRRTADRGGVGAGMSDVSVKEHPRHSKPSLRGAQQQQQQHPRQEQSSQHKQEQSPARQQRQQQPAPHRQSRQLHSDLSDSIAVTDYAFQSKDAKSKASDSRANVRKSFPSGQ